MGLGNWIRGINGLGMLLLLLTAGCTVSIQPWSKSAPVPPTNSPPSGEPPGGFPPPPGLLGANATQSSYGPIGANNDQMVRLISQMQEAENQRKTLENQVVELTRKLADRDHAVRQAGLEVETTTRQVERTRQDLGRWRSDMDDLQNRIKKLEDSRNGLKSLIEAVLRELEYDREMRKPSLTPLLSKER